MKILAKDSKWTFKSQDNSQLLTNISQTLKNYSQNGEYNSQLAERAFLQKRIIAKIGSIMAKTKEIIVKLENLIANSQYKIEFSFQTTNISLTQNISNMYETD